MVLTILATLVVLAVSAVGGLYAMSRVESWMVFMDRLYNPPGQRPFPVRRD